MRPACKRLMELRKEDTESVNAEAWLMQYTVDLV